MDNWKRYFFYLLYNIYMSHLLYMPRQILLNSLMEIEEKNYYLLKYNHSNHRNYKQSLDYQIYQRSIPDRKLRHRFDGFGIMRVQSAADHRFLAPRHTRGHCHRFPACG